MASNSKIEWTDCSWQPVTGCSKGCAYCYARKFAARLKAQGKPRYANGFAPTFHPEALSDPLKWRKPRRCFVCSMADLWDPAITNEQIAAVFGVMAACPQHTFQCLTKQAKRMREWFAVGEDLTYDAGEEFAARMGWCHAHEGEHWPLPNAWLGTTVENRDALYRIDDLRRCPAALRFISFEPLQERIGDIDLTGIGWVVIGADSTRGAPEVPLDWVREIRDQCVAAGVPLFFKAHVCGGKRTSLPELDGKVWAQFPEVIRGT